MVFQPSEKAAQAMPKSAVSVSTCARKAVTALLKLDYPHSLFILVRPPQQRTPTAVAIPVSSVFVFAVSTPVGLLGSLVPKLTGSKPRTYSISCPEIWVRDEETTSMAMAL